MRPCCWRMRLPTLYPLRATSQTLRSSRVVECAAMIRINRYFLFCVFVICLMVNHGAVLGVAQDASSNPWKITSVKICKSSGGAIYPSIEAIGVYPVYTFFIPRPVWTVNGIVVESSPIYQSGRLAAFQLVNAAPNLKVGTKNIVKFALPDHNGSRVFIFDPSKFAPNECYEFF